MGTLFYNIVGIIVGILIFCYAISAFNGKRAIEAITCLIISLLLIAVGIYGFFIPKDYGYIIIIALAVLVVILFGLLFLFKKKEKKQK